MSMRDIELRLLSELVKNSRRSDRELARALGVSQPTVTRIRNRLEKEGFIREYTMMPDLTKLGYEILALTFFKYARMLSPEEKAKITEYGWESLKENPFDTIMIASGNGLGYSGVTMSFHKSYTSYEKFRERLSRYAKFGLSEIGVFMMSLSDEAQILPLTLSILARHLATTKEEDRV
jgi:DNA-binding Lrp family transcriptional regulator